MRIAFNKVRISLKGKLTTSMDHGFEAFNRSLSAYNNKMRLRIQGNERTL